MNTHYMFYLCPTCFESRETEDTAHMHVMLCCDPGLPADERRRPLIDTVGRLHTRAPRWFLETVGWIPLGMTSDK